MCAGNELWFSMLYMLHFSEGPAGNIQISAIDVFFTVLFIVISFENYEMGLWRLIFCVVTPIMILKQIISLIHLYTAALDMAAIDEAERGRKK